MDPNMEQQLQVVLSWLKSIYKARPIPQFEVNPVTVSVLYALARRNQTAERDAALLLPDLTQKTQEYIKDTNRLHEILQATGVTASSSVANQSGLIPPATITLDTTRSPPSSLETSLQVLTHLAMSLQLKDTSLSTYMLALADLELQHQRLATSKLEFAHMQKDMARKSQDALKQLDKARHSLSNITRTPVTAASTRMAEAQYYQSKADEYQVTLEELQDVLSATGLYNEAETQVKSPDMDPMDDTFDPDPLPALSHTRLTQLADKLVALQAQTAPHMQTLQSYRDLPPDLSLARVRIEEAKLELARLDEALAAATTHIL
eukprot:TRINITY_DN7259_c0_g1_i3.p1 TRINITY_DN7259_c0_g1~~TRINITY_DN7259_c0_g1_i3.p1  ORF type:complete len:327 (+),score=82.76 TRINITY_DN7259_c0_g1_i3:22-981(+)